MTFLSSWGSEIEAGESGGGHDWPGLLSFHADLHATWPSDLDGCPEMWLVSSIFFRRSGFAEWMICLFGFPNGKFSTWGIYRGYFLFFGGSSSNAKYNPNHPTRRRYSGKVRK